MFSLSKEQLINRSSIAKPLKICQKGIGKYSETFVKLAEYQIRRLV